MLAGFCLAYLALAFAAGVLVGARYAASAAFAAGALAAGPADDDVVRDCEWASDDFSRADADDANLREALRVAEHKRRVYLSSVAAHRRGRYE